MSGFIPETEAGAKAASGIKVLLVDDSPISLAVIGKILSTSPDISVVGIAKNGHEALALIPETRPHVICTDLHMPQMDGLELTREVMERFPLPILVISISVQEGQDNVFKLLEAGAVDVFPKPRGGDDGDFLKKADELTRKIRILSGVRVFRRTKAGTPSRERGVAASFNRGPAGPFKVLAIGASTGGPQALKAIFENMPGDFPVPIVCVQHIGGEFLKGMVEWLGDCSRLKCKIAEEGEELKKAVVYFPQEDAHLAIDRGLRCVSLKDAPSNSHRPSITVTFKSIAERFGRTSIGVLLTGMGKDGAEGLKAIMDAGGFTIAQDEKTSVVFSMPKSAIEMRAASVVLPLDAIAGFIMGKVFA